MNYKCILEVNRKYHIAAYGLSDEPSDRCTFGQMNLRTDVPSDRCTFGQMNLRTFEPSDNGGLEEAFNCIIGDENVSRA